LKVSHLADEPSQLVYLLRDLALLSLGLVFFADKPDTCEVGFVVNDENPPALELGIITVEKLDYPRQVFCLLLRDDDELPAPLALSELARRLHDIEDEDFIFLDEVTKIISEARYSLG